MKKKLILVALMLLVGSIQEASFYKKQKYPKSFSSTSTIDENDFYPDDFEKEDSFSEYPNDFEKEDLSIVSAEPLFPIMKNGTDRDLAITPDICDVDDIDAIREEYRMFLPLDTFCLDSDFIQDSLRLRKQVQKSNKKGSLLGQYQGFDSSPVVIVAYNTSLWANTKIRKAIAKHQDYRGFLDGVGFINYIDFLNQDENGFLLFKTMKRFYYRDVNTEKEFIEADLPHPFLKKRVGNLYPYPFVVKESESKQLYPNRTYELFIHTIETRIIQDERVFICVEDFLDIRSV